MLHSATSALHIQKFTSQGLTPAEDLLAVEEPLEIRIVYGKLGARTEKNISVTMRTPGNDAELAIGFLFTEAILKDKEEIKSIRHLDSDKNIILIELDEQVSPAIQKLERNFYTTSSCGVCGKSSIDAIRVVCASISDEPEFQISSQTLIQLPDLLRKKQNVFESTGGLHASALFNLNAELLFLKEDVGRHNALDKLIGEAFMENSLPLSTSILLLSGRASFELIQKAAMAGIRVIAAVGAPSSLAVELAKEFKITLVGFLRGERFNIYCNEQRIKI